MQPWSNNKRDFSFARPVASIGSTTCKNSEEIVHPDGQDEWFCVEGVTSTPGVPSGKRCVHLFWGDGDEGSKGEIALIVFFYI